MPSAPPPVPGGTQAAEGGALACCAADAIANVDDGGEGGEVEVSEGTSKYLLRVMFSACTGGGAGAGIGAGIGGQPQQHQQQPGGGRPPAGAASALGRIGSMSRNLGLARGTPPRSFREALADQEEGRAGAVGAAAAASRHRIRTAADPGPPGASSSALAPGRSRSYPTAPPAQIETKGSGGGAAPGSHPAPYGPGSRSRSHPQPDGACSPLSDGDFDESYCFDDGISAITSATLAQMDLAPGDGAGTGTGTGTDPSGPVGMGVFPLSYRRNQAQQQGRGQPQRQPQRQRQLPPPDVGPDALPAGDYGPVRARPSSKATPAAPVVRNNTMTTTSSHDFYNKFREEEQRFWEEEAGNDGGDGAAAAAASSSNLDRDPHKPPGRKQLHASRTRSGELTAPTAALTSSHTNDSTLTSIASPSRSAHPGQHPHDTSLPLQASDFLPGSPFPPQLSAVAEGSGGSGSYPRKGRGGEVPGLINAGHVEVGEI